LLPKKYNKIHITKYISKITTRPRDIISLFNICIRIGVNQNKLTASEFSSAESEYSRYRLRSLGDEWNASYPSLLDFTKIIEKKSSSFKASTITAEEIEELCLTTVINNPNCEGILQQYSSKVIDNLLKVNDFKFLLLQVFYRVALIGIKTQTFEKESWSDELGRSLISVDVSEDSSIVVHPMYYRALGIKFYG
jgi:hypothetical protein